jgi:hypothetical protein
VPGGRFELAILAEHLDRVDVYHIGQNGRVFGSITRGAFPDRRVDGLLDAWLNALKNRAVAFALPPDSVSLRIPRLGDGEGSYEITNVRIDPPAFPVEILDGGSREFAIRWPPEDWPAGPPRHFLKPRTPISSDPGCVSGDAMGFLSGGVVTAEYWYRLSTGGEVLSNTSCP